MSFFALNNEIARKLGIGRVTEKFRLRIKEVLRPWAGISKSPKANPTIWLSKENVTDFIPWRGIAPTGLKRTWQEISYHEQLGISEVALQTDGINPEIAIKEMFQLNRLNEKTKEEFLSWINNYRAYRNSKF